jgi:hypothetical protein
MTCLGLDEGWSWGHGRGIVDEERRRYRRDLERARSVFEADPGAAPISDELRRSWMRCAPVVTPETDAVPVEATDEVADRWDASPIRRAVPGLVDQLETIARDGDFVAAVTDADGQILWSWGGRTMRSRAEQVNFVAGGRWDEQSAGTNALGLALLTGEPSTVFSAEHWVSAVHDWVCYSAPVRDASGVPLGVIDLSTTWDHANPLGLATVTAFAQLAESQLTDTVAAATGGVVLEALGHGSLHVTGHPQSASLRQMEILVVLALAGEVGLAELHALLYGDRPVSPATLKAEISHLRRMLDGAIASRPYRLTGPFVSDVGDLLASLSRGDVRGAAARYAGQLLPMSEAPFVVERRHHLDVALRTAVLRDGGAAEHLRFAEVHPFDLEVLEHGVAVAPADDPLLPDLTARLAVALGD